MTGEIGCSGETTEGKTLFEVEETREMSGETTEGTALFEAEETREMSGETTLFEAEETRELSGETILFVAEETREMSGKTDQVAETGKTEEITRVAGSETEESLNCQRCLCYDLSSITEKIMSVISCRRILPRNDLRSS